MKKIINIVIKYSFLTCYFILALVLILEACMPGSVSAGQSNNITETITNQTGIGSGAEFIVPTSIEINNEKNYIYSVGEKININCTVLPKNASKKTIKYQISSNIATIKSDGTLIFNQQGKITLKAWIDEYEDIYDTIELEATQKIIPIQKLNIYCDNNDLNVGSKYQLHVLTTPSDTTDKNILWEVLNPDIASIDQNGVLTCLKEGEVEVRLSSKDNLDIYVIKTFVITKFIEIPVEQLILKPTANYENGILTICEDETIQLNKYLSIYPQNANNIKLIWKSDNEKTAMVLPNGKLRALEGSNNLVKIKVCSQEDEGIYSDILVKVISREPLLDMDNELTISINANKKIKFKDTSIFPNHYEITYKIEDEQIATVDAAGIVYGNKKGQTNCLITCTSGDGKIKVFNVSIEIVNPPKASFYMLIRKGIGHFGSFLVLALIACGVCCYFFKNKNIFILISLVVGFSLAGTTEIIQLYVEGRTGTFSDVMIDFSGYLIGTIISFGLIYLIILIKTIKKRRRETYGK